MFCMMEIIKIETSDMQASTCTLRIKVSLYAICPHNSQYALMTEHTCKGNSADARMEML